MSDMDRRIMPAVCHAQAGNAAGRGAERRDLLAHVAQPKAARADFESGHLPQKVNDMA